MIEWAHSLARGVSEKIAMEVLEKSLCSNCLHHLSCALKNGRPVQECNEHASADLESKNAFSHSEKEPTEKPTHFQGLCGTCDLAANCKWRSGRQVVFHCEHYQ
jgi:hypothetical protein